MVQIFPLLLNDWWQVIWSPSRMVSKKLPPHKTNETKKNIIAHLGKLCYTCDHMCVMPDVCVAVLSYIVGTAVLTHLIKLCSWLAFIIYCANTLHKRNEYSQRKEISIAYYRHYYFSMPWNRVRSTHSKIRNKNIVTVSYVDSGHFSIEKNFGHVHVQSWNVPVHKYWSCVLHVEKISVSEKR